jgi:hypothetical protein
MTKLYVKESGVWRDIKEVFVKDSEQWRSIDTVHVKDGGVWKKVFQSGWIIGSGADQSTFYEFTTELIESYGDAVLSAGPITGNRVEGTTGTWEIVMAPGYRLSGDTGDTNSYTATHSVRYLFTVAANGSATLNAASGAQTTGGTSVMTSYSPGVTRVSVAQTSLYVSELAAFPHIVQWGNSNASARSSTFVWTPPTGATGILVSGIGGGGGGGNGGGFGGGGSASGGGGGGSGGVYKNFSGSFGEFSITLGAGGTSGGPLDYNQQQTRENAGTNGSATVVAINSTTLFTANGGVGGQGGFNAYESTDSENDTLNNPDTGNTGGAGGSPNGAAGGKGSYRLSWVNGQSIQTYVGGSLITVTGSGYAGANNSVTGFTGGAGGGRASEGSSGGGGGGAGFANGPVGNTGTGVLGSGGGGGGGEMLGLSGGNGYAYVTWTA